MIERAEAVGNGWARGFDVPWPICPRWIPSVHPIHGVLSEHGPNVPQVFFLKFRYPVQTAASYGIADPQAFTAPVITWISRN